MQLTTLQKLPLSQGAWQTVHGIETAPPVPRNLTEESFEET